LRRQRGSFPQQCRCVGELGLVLDVVGHHDELVAVAADGREESGCGGLRLAGQRVDPLLDFRLRGALGIEIGGLGLLWRASHEKPIVIEP
jgi:hypothetical protein